MYELEKSYLDDGALVIVYGASVHGEYVNQILKNLNIPIAFFCDGAKVGTCFFNKEVKSPEVLKNYKNAHIIIAAGVKHYEIRTFLTQIGCTRIYTFKKLLSATVFDKTQLSIQGQDIEHYKNLYEFGISYNPESEAIDIPNLDLVITEKCSMKCKDCSNLMQYYAVAENYTVEEIEEQMSKLLQTIDKIIDLRILGGEPFVNDNFGDILNLFVDNDKITNITIYSNATILPNKKLILILKNRKIKVELTNYGVLSKKHKAFLDICEKESIRCYSKTVNEWHNLGELKNKEYSNRELVSVYEKCECKELPTLLKGKLFCCPYSAHGYNLKAIPTSEDDYVDFLKENADEMELKMQIKKLLHTKRYLSACGYCNGRSFKQGSIPVAIQTNAPLYYERLIY